MAMGLSTEGRFAFALMMRRQYCFSKKYVGNGARWLGLAVCGILGLIAPPMSLLCAGWALRQMNMALWQKKCASWKAQLAQRFTMLNLIKVG